jgi:hypothetical protein
MGRGLSNGGESYWPPADAPPHGGGGSGFGRNLGDLGDRGLGAGGDAFCCGDLGAFRTAVPFPAFWCRSRTVCAGPAGDVPQPIRHLLSGLTGCACGSSVLSTALAILRQWPRVADLHDRRTHPSVPMTRQFSTGWTLGVRCEKGRIRALMMRGAGWWKSLRSSTLRVTRLEQKFFGSFFQKRTASFALAFLRCACRASDVVR